MTDRRISSPKPGKPEKLRQEVRNIGMLAGRRAGGNFWKAVLLRPDSQFQTKAGFHYESISVGKDELKAALRLLRVAA